MTEDKPKKSEKSAHVKEDKKHSKSAKKSKK